MIRIGQLGIGHNHSDKLKAIKRHPECFELVGYAEENEEWIRRRGQKPHFADVPRLSVEEVLEKSDAILVETDVWDLTKTAQKCIDAGKHIHMDKPASGTVEEFAHLLKSAEAKGLVVQLGYMYRYNPAILKLMDMVRTGQLGDISAIDAQMSLPHSDKYRAWLRNFKGGDLYIFGSHLIDLVVYLLGKPRQVQAAVLSSGKNGVDAPDLTAATLLYDHTIARVFSSSVEWDGWARRCFSVAGSLGTAHIQPIEVPSRLTFAPKNDGGVITADLARPIEVEQFTNDRRYDTMLLAFHDYVVGKAVNPFSYAHDLVVHQVLDEAVGGIEALGKNLE